MKVIATAPKTKVAVSINKDSYGYLYGHPVKSGVVGDLIDRSDLFLAYKVLWYNYLTKEHRGDFEHLIAELEINKLTELTDRFAKTIISQAAAICWLLNFYIKDKEILRSTMENAF